MEQQWQQVLSRDARADGKFVYAVRSTHIYCRPTCPSRRPRRANVDFFAQPSAAERAGFRACKRCRPNSANPQAAIVEAACKFVDSHLDSRVTLSQLAKHTGYSPFHLQRMFKKTLGISPQQYHAQRRLSNLKSGLRTNGKVIDAAYDAGYSSSSRLYEKGTSQIGMTPASYGKNGAGAQIAYTIFDSDLGKVLVAKTERGICSLRFASSAAELEKELRAEFSAADISRNDSALTSTVSTVRRCLAGGSAARQLPFDVQATAFQRLVWAELQRIPSGGTRTYQDVAQSVGHPRSHRAVARACASNHVAVLIPCHRVVSKSGRKTNDAGGYRWGKERKAALLKAESRK